MKLKVNDIGRLIYGDKVDIGSVYREVDGYMVYVPNDNSGFFNEYTLRMIADFLEEQNKEWDDKIKNDILLNEI